MRSLFVLFILMVSYQTSFAQETDSASLINYSSTYVPDNCFDSVLYIEKLEEISYHQVPSIIDSKKFKSEKKLAFEGIEYHNSVSVIYYNQLFEKTVANEKNLSLATIYKGDVEKTPRYSIVSKYDFSPYLRGRDDMKYAIFDNKTNTRYAYFSSLEVLFVAVRKSKIYMDQSASRNQDDLDAYLNKKVPKLERKAVPRDRGMGNFWLIFAGVLSAFVLVANLVTL